METGKVCLFILLAALGSWAASPSETEDVLRQGRLLQSQGKLVEARQRFEDALGKATGVPEQADLQVSALSNLANVEIDLGRPESAARLFNQAIRVLQSGRDDQTPNIENLRVQLAELYLEAGETMTAETLVKQVMGSQAARGAADTADAALAGDVLACVYARQKKLREAETGERKALAILDALGRQGHAEYAVAMLHLGSVLSMRNRPADALPYLERALAAMRRLPLHNPDMEGAAEIALAHAYSSTGRAEEALNSAEDARRTIQNYFGPSHPRTAGALLEEAAALKKVGQKTAARRAQLEGERIISENKGTRVASTVPVEALVEQKH